MIHGHFVADVVNFNNEQVKVNSLHKHPTQGRHEEVLHYSCYSYTGALQQKAYDNKTARVASTLRKSLSTSEGEMQKL